MLTAWVGDSGEGWRTGSERSLRKWPQAHLRVPEEGSRGGLVRLPDTGRVGWGQGGAGGCQLVEAHLQS